MREILSLIPLTVTAEVASSSLVVPATPFTQSNLCSPLVDFTFR